MKRASKPALHMSALSLGNTEDQRRKSVESLIQWIQASIGRQIDGNEFSKITSVTIENTDTLTKIERLDMSSDKFCQVLLYLVSTMSPLREVEFEKSYESVFVETKDGIYALAYFDDWTNVIGRPDSSVNSKWIADNFVSRVRVPNGESTYEHFPKTDLVRNADTEKAVAILEPNIDAIGSIDGITFLSHDGAFSQRPPRSCALEWVEDTICCFMVSKFNVEGVLDDLATVKPNGSIVLNGGPDDIRRALLNNPKD